MVWWGWVLVGVGWASLTVFVVLVVVGGAQAEQRAERVENEALAREASRL